MVIVLVIAIIVFSIVKIDIIFWLLFLLRIPLILPIAGIAYEVLKIVDKFKKNIFFRALTKPGLWVQRLTTKEPDKKQIEVAIKSLQTVLSMKD